MISVSCDRCNKPLVEGEGYQINVMGRAMRFTNSGIQNPMVYMPNPDADPPFAGEICLGCYDLLHFFFKEKFREVNKIG